jgi:hypothetical protein
MKTPHSSTFAWQHSGETRHAWRQIQTKWQALILGAVLTVSACQPEQSGPTDAVIRDQYKEEQKIYGPIIEIKRGKLMQATGEGGIPKNTLLYPVRVRFGPMVKGNWADPYTELTAYFYQNEFREWMDAKEFY